MGESSDLIPIPWLVNTDCIVKTNKQQQKNPLLTVKNHVCGTYVMKEEKTKTSHFNP